jgi:3-hydroxyacyl-[acyl-carrier-protein] dehydratase
MVGIRDLVFTAPAVPGDVLEHHVHLHHHSGAVGEFTGQTRAAGRTVLTVGSVLVVSRPASSLLSATPLPPQGKDDRCTTPATRSPGSARSWRRSWH